jgi:aryl-alcohol dehydrogenase-like predicted oxidoreductase
MVTTRSAATEWRVVDEKSGAKMAYRYLGNTGLKVSVISYGNMTAHDLGGNARDEESQKFANDSVKYCFEKGINFFDSAELYAFGAQETQLGIALKNLNVPRKDYIVSVKLFFGGYGFFGLFGCKRLWNVP